MNPQQIQELLNRYVDGSATDEEASHLLQWYRNSDVNDITWPNATDDRQKLSERMLRRLQGDIKGQRGRVINVRKWAVAASVTLVACISILAYLLTGNRAEYLTVTNASGAVRLVTLPDSSKVWLNAATTLHYNKNFSDDRSLLLDGHAYLDVVENRSRPFTIKTGDVLTTVVGTSFTIKAYSSDSTVKVDVVTGKVKVSGDDRELTTLLPSKGISYNKFLHSAELHDSDTAAVISWMHGQLQFKGEPLSEIARSIGRWYGYTINIKDASALNCRYYMNLESGQPIENILTVVKELTALHYIINKQERSISLSGKACN